MLHKYIIISILMKLSCMFIYGVHFLSDVANFVKNKKITIYSKLPVIWYPNIQDSHANWRNSKENTYDILLSYFKTNVVMCICSPTTQQFSQLSPRAQPTILPHQVPSIIGVYVYYCRG